MKVLVAILTIGLCAVNGYSFGPRGQRLVGAIADRRLADPQNATTRKKVAELLDGMTLEAVSTLPDSIKSWSVARASQTESFHVTGHPRIEAELRAFVNANSGPGIPTHQQFHYTDVPVFGNEKYDSGMVGRSEFDIVHMIAFCIRVLKGQVPEKNERAITKTVALILLAHFLADIHQPLHVGAQYYDASGMPFTPTPGNSGFEDQGGSTINLFLQRKELSIGRLHGFWDTVTVTLAFGDVPDQQIVTRLAKEEPTDWKLASSIENWGEELANEVLPVARQAYARLEFHIKVGQSKTIVFGNAVERTPNDGVPYEVWASRIAKQQIHKAGWRLAALLEEALK